MRQELSDAIREALKKGASPLSSLSELGSILKKALEESEEGEEDEIEMERQHILPVFSLLMSAKMATKSNEKLSYSFDSEKGFTFSFTLDGNTCEMTGTRMKDEDGNGMAIELKTDSEEIGAAIRSIILSTLKVI
jgi:hypothetical protein